MGQGTLLDGFWIAAGDELVGGCAEAFRQNEDIPVEQFSLSGLDSADGGRVHGEAHRRHLRSESLFRPPPPQPQPPDSRATDVLGLVLAHGHHGACGVHSRQGPCRQA